MIKFWIAEPIYGTDTLFLGNCKHSEVVAYLKKDWGYDLDDSPMANGQMITLRKGSIRQQIVWVKEMEADSPYWTGVAVHEMFHLTVRICNRIGIPIRDYFQETGENADEAAAYLLGFFTQKYFEELKKITNKKNKKYGRRRNHSRS